MKWVKIKCWLRDHGLNLWKQSKLPNICKLNSKKLMYLEREFPIFIILWMGKSQDMEENLNQLNLLLKFKYWLKDLGLIQLKPLNNHRKFKRIQLKLEYLVKEFRISIILWMEKNQAMENCQYIQNQHSNRKSLLN